MPRWIRDRFHGGSRLHEGETDDLILELDRRLAEQGFDVEVAGVEVVVGYLREGWSVVALPPEMAENFEGSRGGHTVHYLAAELRRRLAGGPILTPEDAKELLEVIELKEAMDEDGGFPELGPSPEETAAKEKLRAIAEGR